MYLCYFDESGDDGYPVFSSQLFVLSSLYMQQSTWKSNFEKVGSFRKQLKKDYNFPVKQEFHTMHFLADKDPYHGKYTPQVRKEILNLFCELINILEAKIISVVIDKNKIYSATYDVLEKALTYNIQRIENDMNYSDLTDKDYMIISDEGRVASMRKVTRKIQRINFIPSKYNRSTYRREIEHLIEDPLPKPSEESYLIQLADVIATAVMLYSRRNLVDTPIKWANRVRRVIDYNDEIDLMQKMKGSFNLKASGQNEFGIVYYPT